MFWRACGEFCVVTSTQGRKHMKRHLARIVICLFLPVFLAGCLPDGMIRWSPDGQYGAVISRGKLYLTDTEGNLTDCQVEDVTSVAWMPDGSALLVFQSRLIGTWDHLVRALGKEEAEVINTAADHLLTLMEAEGKEIGLGGVEPLGPHLEDDTRAENIIFCAIQRYPDRTKAVLRKIGAEDPDDIVDGDDLPFLGKYTVCHRFEIRQGEVGRREEIWTLGREVRAPVVDPTGKQVAFRAGRYGKPGLMSTALLDKEPRPMPLAANVLGEPFWSPDGKSLAFLALPDWTPGHSETDAERLEDIALLMRTTPANRTADVADTWEEEANQPKLERILWITPSPALGQASPGRLVVQSRKVNMTLDPSRKTQAEGILAPQQVTISSDGVTFQPVQLPAALTQPVESDQIVRICPSPDGQALAVQRGEGLEILRARSGEVLARDENLRVAYRGHWAWWTGTKLFWVSCGQGKDDRPKLMCYQEGKTREVSKGWPDEVLAGFRPSVILQSEPVDPGSSR